MTNARINADQTNVSLLFHGQCRLDLVSGSLALNRFNGKYLVIAGNPEVIPETAPTLAATGLTAGTNYYIYAYMNSGVMTLEASTTGYITSAATGVKIKSTDSTRTLVGLARPYSGPVWIDTSNYRQVISYFNRKPKNFFIAVSTTTAAVDWSAMSGTADFLTWGGTTVLARCTVDTYMSTHGYTGYFGIAFNNVTPSYGTGERVQVQTSTWCPVAVEKAEYFSGDGFGYVRVWGFSVTSGYTLYAYEGAINGEIWG
jgi:hypothetical protein